MTKLENLVGFIEERSGEPDRSFELLLAVAVVDPGRAAARHKVAIKRIPCRFKLAPAKEHDLVDAALAPAIKRLGRQRHTRLVERVLVADHKKTLAGHRLEIIAHDALEHRRVAVDLADAFAHGHRL